MIDIDCEYIGAEGAKYIADALKVNNTLNSLDLGIIHLINLYR